MNAGAFGAQAPPHDPQTVARAVLAQPRFRVPVNGPAPHTWWDVVRDWIGAQWNRLMEAFGHRVHLGPAAGAAVGDALIAALVLLVLIVGVRLLLAVAREGDQTRSVSRALPGPSDAAALYTAAQSAARNARYAAAIALLFRAALASLDARGVLRDDPARTVNECRSDVRVHAPALTAQFDVIARAFTGAVYAEERVDVQQWSAVERAYAAFLPQRSDGA